MKILLMNPPASRRTLSLEQLAWVEPLRLEVVGARSGAEASPTV